MDEREAMTDINPNNYDGSNVTVVGRAGGEPEVRTFGNGGSQTQLTVAVSKGYKDRNSGEWKDTGTDWYTVTATPEYADENWPTIEKGDKVRIDNGRLEFRPYLTKDGEARVEARITYGTLVVVEAKGDRPAAGVKAF